MNPYIHAERERERFLDGPVEPHPIPEDFAFHKHLVRGYYDGAQHVVFSFIFL